MQVANCADYECRFNANGACIKDKLNINCDRFCTDGQRKDRDMKDLMCQFNPQCRKTSGGYKSNHGRVVR